MFAGEWNPWKEVAAEGDVGHPSEELKAVSFVV